MRIAVTYENGQIFQHFGRTEQFKLYDIAYGKVIGEQIVGTMGAGHGALAGFLKNAEVDVLICGGIGGGAQMAMRKAGITLYGGNILNILDRYRELFDSDPDYVITGFHMMKRESAHTDEEKAVIIQTAQEHSRLDTVFYSGHCTGI